MIMPRSIGDEVTALANACDTHLHFYDRRHEPARTARLYPPDATPDDYRKLQDRLGLERLVVVQPTTYGLDNTCQLDAMASFGDAARGVMVVDATVSDDELGRLTRLGVRGARFHMLPGGAVPWEMLDEVAGRIAPFGWHIQLQLNGRELAARRERLLRLPVDVVVDHIGRFMPPVDPDDPSFTALVDLAESGRCWVKLSAPYESSAGPVTDSAVDHADLRLLIEALVDRVPERLLWATNWPHPGQAVKPSPRVLAAQLAQWVDNPNTRRTILVDNPDMLYFHDPS